jgi:hypothetical protein
MKLAEVIMRAHREPGFRGQLIWFPEKIADFYGLDEVEAAAARTGDMTAVDIPDDVREIAGIVYDLHDLHSGE